MATNKAGFKRDYKCNMCGTTEAKKWFHDNGRVLETGFLCSPCSVKWRYEAKKVAYGIGT